MADENGAAADAVTVCEALRREPYRFDFFHALRLLECAASGRPRLGRSAKSADDAVRLGQEPSLAFAPATLASYEPGRKGGPPGVRVFFLGLFGPNGPLPLHLTEYARDRLRNSGDPTLVRFADLFHHRILSLFYRAWADAQPTVSFDRPEEDRFSAYVGSLVGLGMPSLRGRDAVPDLAKLHRAGRLAGASRNAEGLEGLLADFFDLPVEVVPFFGQWLGLDERDQLRLGEARETGILGGTAVLGARTWDRAHGFRVAVGPLALRDYERLLPGGEALRRMVAMVRGYTGDELAWGLKLVLRKEEVPTLSLGRTGLLGWTTWLGTEPHGRDAADLVVSVEGEVSIRKGE